MLQVLSYITTNHKSHNHQLIYVNLIFWVQTHFFANGMNGHEIFMRTDGTISANKRTPVDGASHTF